jgi:hypothetical protein
MFDERSPTTGSTIDHHPLTVMEPISGAEKSDLATSEA